MSLVLFCSWDTMMILGATTSTTSDIRFVNINVLHKWHFLVIIIIIYSYIGSYDCVDAYHYNLLPILPPWRGLRQLLEIGPWGHLLDDVHLRRRSNNNNNKKQVLYIERRCADKTTTPSSPHQEHRQPTTESEVDDDDNNSSKNYYFESTLIDSSTLPPCPSSNHRRIVATSDTHGKHRFVHIPECDILVHCGDILQRYGYIGDIGGGLPSFLDFVSWIQHPTYVPAKYGVVVIAGNHDHLLESLGKTTIQSIFDSSTPRRRRKRRRRRRNTGSSLSSAAISHVGNKKCYYLENGSIEIGGITLYGSPWSPTGGTGNRAFQQGTNASIAVGLASSTDENYQSACQEEIDILLTHAKCSQWHDFISKSNVQLWVHGHWHDNQGTIHQVTKTKTSIPAKSPICLSVNVASNDMIYRPINPPIVMDVPIRPTKIE